MRLKKGLRYKLEWNDTYSYTGWFNEEDIKDLTVPVLQETVGFYVETRGVWYVFAMHKNGHDGFKPWGTVCWIPKSCVKKITSFA